MKAAVPARTADAHVHRLYAEHSGLPVGVVTQCAQHAVAASQLVWPECAGASWAEKARTFFEQHEESLFLQMHRSTSRAHRRQQYVDGGLWELLVAGQVGSVLDFGGGLGLTSSLLQEAGQRVTYCDVDGPAARFARWYFDYNGQETIEVLHTAAAMAPLPDRQWDLVNAESVLEYLGDPVATVECLADAVRPGGVLHLELDQHEASSACPMRRLVTLAALLDGSPTLRAMQSMRDPADGHVVLRKR